MTFNFVSESFLYKWKDSGKKYICKLKAHIDIQIYF